MEEAIFMLTFPKIKSVKPLANKCLLVEFTNDDIKIYDCRPLLEQYVFTPLKDEAFFGNVRVDKAGYGVVWNDYIDLSEAELWINGVSESKDRY